MSKTKQELDGSLNRLTKKESLILKKRKLIVELTIIIFLTFLKTI